MLFLFYSWCPNAVLTWHLGLWGAPSPSITPYFFPEKFWTLILTLFAYQVRGFLSASFILLDQRANLKITMLKFLLSSVDQSLSEENFWLFLYPRSACLLVAIKYYRGRIGNRMEKHCVKVVLYISLFEITPFICKNFQSKFSWASCHQLWYFCADTCSGGCKQCYCLWSFVFMS